MALAKPKSKVDLFKLERATWRKLNAPVQDLPAAAWTQPGAAGDWSFKDVWAHIADWMIETRRRIPMILSGKKFRTDIQAFNEKHYRKNRKLTARAARARLERERTKFLLYLKSLSQEQLLSNRRVYTWASYSTYNHYAEHIPSLVRFSRKIARRRQK